METNEPVSDQVFHVLLSLVEGPRHGYGIIRDIGSRTGGTFTIGSGTLYSAIKRLRAKGWVEQVPPPHEGDARRKYYALTPVGRDVVRKEAHRLATLAEYARSKNLLSSPAD